MYLHTSLYIHTYIYILCTSIAGTGKFTEQIWVWDVCIRVGRRVEIKNLHRYVASAKHIKSFVCV